MSSNTNNTENKITPPSNPKLTSAIAVLQACDDASKKQALTDDLIKEIYNATYILPAADIQQTSKAVTRNNNTVMQPAAKVELRLVKNANGDSFFCGFTDEDELLKAKMEGKMIFQRFQGIFELLKVSEGISGFIINPLGKNVILTKQMCGFISEMMGVMPEVPSLNNNELKTAIENMQQDGTPENIEKMVQATIKSTFILPAKKNYVAEAKSEGNGTFLIPRVNVNFMLLNYNNGNSFFGAFTDMEELKKWNDSDDVQFMYSDFENLSAVVSNSSDNITGFIVNPNGKSVTFPKPMVNQLKQQSDYLKLEKHTLKPGEKIQLAEPDEYPIDLMAALINHFSTEQNVNAAYLRLLKTEDGKKSFFIVVDFVGNMKEVFDGISHEAQPYLDDELELTMMPYSMEFARNAVRGIEPFYKKAED